jgi:hypothetical protein
MKPAHLRLSDRWCRLMHSEPMWPSHGQYECRTCGRRYRVCWEEPLPARSRVLERPCETAAPGALIIVTEPGTGIWWRLTGGRRVAEQ